MDVARLRRSLLRWFEKARRPLPWRRTRDPYLIWVSEVMLQQTTVATVTPYYERFVKQFPTVADLAASDEDRVLSLWSGLGYYSRARNLRLSAQVLIEHHGGQFPKNVATAMTLKGVGRYTASAVTSIAYGTRAAVVDGNVRRVISRLCAVRGLNDASMLEAADRLLAPRVPGVWNEAMMELGATVCTSRTPQCGSCPVARDCLGRERAHHWGKGKVRRATVPTAVSMALVMGRKGVLLVRNPRTGLLASLYELPHAGLPGDEPATSLEQRYPGVLRVGTKALATIRHSITHHRIEATIFKAALVGRTAVRDASFHPIAEAFGLPLGTLSRKALNAVGVLGPV